MHTESGVVVHLRPRRQKDYRTPLHYGIIILPRKCKLARCTLLLTITTKMLSSIVKAPTVRLARMLVERTLQSNCTGFVFKHHRTSENLRSIGTFESKRIIAKTQQQFFSAMATDTNDDHFGPMGELFELKRGEGIDESLVGKTASIRRVFGAGANANGLLTCGGEELARHSSFDPDYSRARGWIQNRAIGPAVLSPVLISGLVGALVEAAFPQSVPVNSSMHQARPLIVGQEVFARVQVTGVKHFTRDGVEVSTKEKDFGSRQDGHEIQLATQVIRTQDNEIIAEGSHSVWIPGYLAQ